MQKIEYHNGVIYITDDRISAVDSVGNQEGPFESVREAREWIDEREYYMSQFKK